MQQLAEESKLKKELARETNQEMRRSTRSRFTVKDELVQLPIHKKQNTKKREADRKELLQQAHSKLVTFVQKLANEFSEAETNNLSKHSEFLIFTEEDPYVKLVKCATNKIERIRKCWEENKDRESIKQNLIYPLQLAIYEGLEKSPSTRQERRINQKMQIEGNKENLRVTRRKTKFINISEDVASTSSLVQLFDSESDISCVIIAKSKYSERRL